MNIAFYTGKTGLIAQQEGLNVYSNNICKREYGGLQGFPSELCGLYLHGTEKYGA